jgi:alpha-D-xyloside xylohydrolase
MDFPHDGTVKDIGDQFMFGPSLLINPVYNYKARTRQLHLPAGQGWYNFYSGEFINGGKDITADAPYERIPVFVKEGSIIPFGPEIQYTNEKPADTINLYIYTGKDAAFSLYEDEDTNYNYEKGKFSNIPLKYNEATRQLLIGERQGSFEGMLTNRVFKVTWITKTKPKALDFENKGDAEIKYDGTAVTVKM